MRPIMLTPRLLALSRQVPRGARFADVGTDHARLPVWLLEQGVIEQAIATDLREGPLQRARQTAARHGLTERISFRLGDGLAPVRPEEADVIAIAGMGGETIASILETAAWTREGEHTFLLQPMTSVPDLRLWLAGPGFSIQREELIREGETLYHTMQARPGPMSALSPGEAWAGRQYRGMDSPWRTEYLTLLLNRTSRALEGLRRSTKPGDAGRLEELTERYADLARMKEEWDKWQR